MSELKLSKKVNNTQCTLQMRQTLWTGHLICALYINYILKVFFKNVTGHVGLPRLWFVGPEITDLQITWEKILFIQILWMRHYFWPQSTISICYLKITGSLPRKLVYRKHRLVSLCEMLRKRHYSVWFQTLSSFNCSRPLPPENVYFHVSSYTTYNKNHCFCTKSVLCFT